MTKKKKNKYLSKIHEEVPYELNDGQTVFVDKKILGTCRWINSFPGVITQYSCEGGKEDHNYPYILFLCYELKSLKKIAEATRDGNGNRFANLSVDIYENEMRFIIRWLSLNHFNKFKKMHKIQ